MSSYDEIDNEYVCYKDREEWADLKPVKQYEGNFPVVKIAYSKEFSDAYDYFRGVVAAGELSERALLLTEDCIDFNAANYTVWQYRRQILKHINGDLRKELSYCRAMIEENPKNYQVWHHRRVIVEWLGNDSCQEELKLTQMIFQKDSKNYHAWEHRQWALRTFKIYEGELAFTEVLLTEDIRNNSAWNHRYFVLSRTSGLTLEVLQKEIKFTKKAIEKLIDNESPWSYLKGLLNDSCVEDESELHKCWEDVETWSWGLVRSYFKDCEGLGYKELINSPNLQKEKECLHLLIGILDCLIHKLDYRASKSEKESTLGIAVMLCDALSSTHDVIREKYWQYLKKQISKKHSPA